MSCLCADTVAPKCPVHGYDATYWGTSGPRPSTWGNECQRGCAYKDVGTTVDGAKDQRRSISSGRKARGYASGTDGKPENEGTE